MARVQNFDADFDYRDELIHGHRNGWRQVEFGGSSDAGFCNYIWGLSDIISFESDMAMPETGWLLNITNRYGRPVVCANWKPQNQTVGEETLELFSNNKVYWFNNSDKLSPQLIESFRFSRITTPRK